MEMEMAMAAFITQIIVLEDLLPMVYLNSAPSLK
jgi:hypothetical protein